MWTPKQFKQHKRAAFLLDKIKDEAFNFITNRMRLPLQLPLGPPSLKLRRARKGERGVSEWQAHKFILSRYKKYGLTVAKSQTIVAFGKNTQHIHYYPSKREPRTVRAGDLIMIDIWARLKEPGAPYADITWMGYCTEKFKIKDQKLKRNNHFKEFKKVFDIVVGARDECLKFIREHAKFGILPTGKEMDSIARNFIAQHKLEHTFRHSTGHGLGLVSPHWRGRNLSQRNKHALLQGIGYTIEPGVYLKNKFGVRSEMNFYIDGKMKLIMTTPLQRKIEAL